jgi:(1->4)-alpha-D-glucan 1-alpha-D-glucosylmutase
VNYEVRRQTLKSLEEQAARDRAALMDRLRENLCDGAIKLYTTSEALRFRRDHTDLFQQGSYTALAADGNRERHVIAFARTFAHQTLIAVTGRFFLKLCNSHSQPIGEIWGNTSVALPKKIANQSFRNIFTGETVAAEQRDAGLFLPASKVFSHAPVALLFAESAV